MSLILLCLALALPARAAKQELTVQETYELGLRYLKSGSYVKALEQFNRVRLQHRDDPLSVKAELAIADVYYEKNDWDQARLAYQSFAPAHPHHPDLDYVVYRQGLCLSKKVSKVAARDQTWTRQLVTVLTGFDRRFPESSYSGEAAEVIDRGLDRLARKELIIARFYVRRDAWPAVEGRAAGLLDRYPDSDYAPEALNLLATSMAWQGRKDEAEAVAGRLMQTDPSAGSRLLSEIGRIEPPEPRR